MKVLVTGAAGFIGSAVSRALIAGGYDVIGIDNFDEYYPRVAKELNLRLINGVVNPNILQNDDTKIWTLMDRYYNFSKIKKVGSFEFIEADIRDYKLINKIFINYKPQKVLHLAAMAGVDLSTTNPLKYVDVNIMGSTILLEVSRKSQIQKFVFGSSSSVYGDRDNYPFLESDRTDNTISPYAATKKMQEVLNQTYSKLYNLPIINARIFGPVYGPLQRPFRMVAQRFIHQTFHDQPMTIYGDGKVGARDTTYIDDIVEGLILCLEGDIHFDTFNIGSGKSITPIEVANEVIRHFGKGEILYLDRALSEAKLTFADVQKSKKMLNYSAKMNFAEGMNRQIKVFMATPDWYKQMHS